MSSLPPEGAASRLGAARRRLDLPLTAFGLVILAGFIHASWNIAAKKANGDARFAFQSGVFLTIVWAPLGLWLGWDVVPHWGVAEWGLVVASGVLHVVYYVTLLRGYRKSDLTVVYPLARGTGPLLSSLVAIVFLGEHISVVGLPAPSALAGVLALGCPTAACGARHGPVRAGVAKVPL